MNAKELRIGNFVHLDFEDDKKTYEVCSLDENDKKLDLIELNRNVGCSWRYSELEPIPLTEEWLERFGFIKSKAQHNDFEIENYFVLDLKGGSFTLCEYIDKSYSFQSEIGTCVVEHVHQLQNLYFALTNTELEIIS